MRAAAAIASAVVFLAACQPGPPPPTANVVNPDAEVLDSAPGLTPAGVALDAPAGPGGVARDCAAQFGITFAGANAVPTGDADRLASYQACVSAGGTAGGVVTDPTTGPVTGA